MAPIRTFFGPAGMPDWGDRAFGGPDGSDLTDQTSDPA